MNWKASQLLHHACVRGMPVIPKAYKNLSSFCKDITNGCWLQKQVAQESAAKTGYSIQGLVVKDIVANG